jgi:hypothetical protein
VVSSGAQVGSAVVAGLPSASARLMADRPPQAVDVLCAPHGDDRVRDAHVDGGPLTGSLTNVATHSPARGLVYAKTGTLVGDDLVTDRLVVQA